MLIVFYGPPRPPRADPPLIPYLGIVLNELSGVVEALPTHLEDQLINFSKMRRVSYSGLFFSQALISHPLPPPSPAVYSSHYRHTAAPEGTI